MPLLAAVIATIGLRPGQSADDLRDELECDLSDADRAELADLCARRLGREVAS
jgi:hypothetical protein